MKKNNESLSGISWQIKGEENKNNILCYSNFNEEKYFTIFSKTTSGLFEKEIIEQYMDFFKYKKDEIKNVKIEDNNLRDYQNEIVNKSINRKGFGNFSEQRTGKTPTTLITLKQWNTKTIIICPSSVVLGTWCSSIKEWLGIEPMTMFENKLNKKQLWIHKSKSKEERNLTYREFFTSEEFNCLVVSKDTIKIDTDILEKNLTKFNGQFNVVVDEAHFLKGWQTSKAHSKQTSICMLLSKYADRRIAITATPSSNHPSEIFGIYHFLWPERFSSYHNFVKFFWGIKKSHFQVKKKFRNKQVESIFKEIYSEMGFRVEQKEVMEWIPEIKYETIELTTKSAQAKEIYDLVCFDKLSKQKEESNEVSQLQKQVEYGILANVFVSETKTNSVKFEWILDHIREYESNNLMIASKWSNRVLVHLSAYLKLHKIKHDLIIGGVSKDKIETIKTNVNYNGGIILTNINILKEGHKLNNINEIIFLDRNWNPSDNEQFIQRMMPTTKEEANLNKYKSVIDLIIKYPINWQSLKDNTLIAKNAKKIVTEQKILELLELKININSYIREMNNVIEQYDFIFN